MPLNDPIGSSAFDVLQRNVQDFDKFENQTSGTVTLRLGEVVTPLPVRDQQFAAKIALLGFTRIEGATFDTGATVPDNRSLLLWDTTDGGTGFYYYFSGEIPSGGKIVPPNSTPASTGGTGAGGWLVIDDLEARLGAIGSDVLVGGVRAGKLSAASGVINLGIISGGFVSGDSAEALANNNAVWSAALTMASTTGMPIFIPPVTDGDWHYSVTPQIPLGCSGVIGVGYASRLRAVGCDGIAFGSSDIIGAKKVSGFSIFSSNIDGGHKGIKIDCGTNPNARLTGLEFENIYIAFFDTPISSKGLWHSKFKQVVTNNCYQAADFYGRNVSINIDSCKFQIGSADRVADTYGVRTRSSTDYDGGGEFRPEAIKITNETLIFGFDIAVDVASCLNFEISGSDIDYYKKYAVRVTTVNGGCIIENNWMAADANSAIGVSFENNAVASTEKKTVRGNAFLVNPGFTASRGIFLGANNGNVTVDSNDISAQFNEGIYNESNSSNNKITNNNVKSVLGLVMNASGNKIDGNDFSGGIQIISATYRNDWGKNSGPTITNEKFFIEMPAGQTLFAASFASLGLGGAVANQQYTLNAYQADQGISAGDVWAVTNGSTFEVRTTSAIGAPVKIGLEFVTY